jgi:uncharacterized membrane protein YdbT with pleckstrin-like domain
MSYVDSELQPGEGIVWRGRGHWLAVFGSPLGLAAFALVLLVNGAGLGWLLLLAALILGGAAWLSWLNQDYAVTERRVIAKDGIIRRQIAELPLRAVESTHVNQSVIGRLLGFGSVVTAGTGGTRVRLQSVGDPMGLRSHIQRQIAAQH